MPEHSQTLEHIGLLPSFQYHDNQWTKRKTDEEDAASVDKQNNLSMLFLASVRWRGGYLKM